jgi:hypothetical protein
MSSHWGWEEKVVAHHNATKPFAPENEQPLKFKIGDVVIYTNDYGVQFKQKITGLYKPAELCSLYATGSRYMLDWKCHWMPASEASLSTAA